MLKLTEKYRPRSLGDVVGQGPVRYLKAIVERPYSCCILLESADGGVGKTSTALAFAADLGCVDEMSGLTIQSCSELTVERARELFYGGSLNYRPMEGPKSGKRWRVVLLEELDWLSPQAQRLLKVALETKLPSSCIVIATSNDSSKLDKPLLQRFDHYAYQAGPCFKEACQNRLLQIWHAEAGDTDPPVQWRFWGDSDGDKFSMRTALTQMQAYLMVYGVIQEKTEVEKVVFRGC